MKSLQRQETQRYHSHLYQNHSLFQKGSWLEKPEPTIIDLVMTHFKNHENTKVLDLGSGVGRHAIPIAQIIGSNGGSVTCVDFLKIAIKKLTTYARQYGVYSYIEGNVCSIENFQITPQLYDLIIAHSVITHIETMDKLLKTLREIREGTKPNGINYLYFATNQRITDLSNNKMLKPEEEIVLSNDQGMTMLQKEYKGWQLIKSSTIPYREQFLRNGTKIQWQVDYVLWIARKIN